MMKTVLELLEELDDITGDLHSVVIYSDFSGHVTINWDKEIFCFNHKKELKKKLRKRIKKQTL